VINGELLLMIDVFFYSHPVFRYDEFANWKAEQGTKHPRAIQNALQYYLNIGRILNIRRGLYAVAPPTGVDEPILVDPYLIAAKVTEDNVLAYHTALELHGVAYTIFDRFTFLTNKKTKPFEFQNHWFQPSSFPKALKKKDAYFGVESINRQELEIKITSLARTFVDVLDRIPHSGGWEEIVRSISKAVSLNIEEVIEYCLMLKNNILVAKVGFFLEQRQGAFAVKNNLLELLLKHKPSSPQSLATSREPGQFIKKWNLIMPKYVLQKSWDEPNHDI